MTENILYLKGIFLKDVSTLEDLWRERLNQDTEEQVTSERVENVMLGVIPKKFTGLGNHPKNTRIRCWHCTLTFETIPVFIPFSTLVNISGVEMSCYGNFCSFPCAQAYIRTYFKDTLHEKSNSLSLLFTIFSGEKYRHIPFAPEKTEMIQFGGNLTTEEYQKIIAKMQKNIGYEPKIETNMIQYLHNGTK